MITFMIVLGFGCNLDKSEAFVPRKDLSGRRAVSSTLQAVSSIAIRPIGYGNNEEAGPALGRSNRDDTNMANTANGVLENLGLPFGLRQVLLHSRDIYKKRIWIVDNSGSMAMQDGHLVLSPDNDSSGACSRWAEASETVNCHAMLASRIPTPTEFRLLNPPSSGGPKSFRVGYGRQIVKDCKRVESSLSRNSPKGQTPLADSLMEVRNEVLKMLPQLQEENQKVAIVIATDGCNHNKDNLGSEITEVDRNQEVLHAIKSLQGLPVTVVTRLCTEYDPLREFYNVLGENLSEKRYGVDVDVIEYHAAEAEQVYQHNPWLNYALVLHRIREMGQDHYLFDVLDDRPFTRKEIKQFCTLLFGYEDWPEDWIMFLQAVHTIQQMEKPHVNPKTKEIEPWIDIQKLFAIGCYWSEE